MTPRVFSIYTAAVVGGVLLGFVLPVPAFACKEVSHPLCQAGETCPEPRCITTSDGAGQPYTDGRRRRAMIERYQRRAAEQQYDNRRRIMDYHRRREEGRSQWQNDGMKTERVGTISPFVPGSVQDTAWRQERKRHGID